MHLPTALSHLFLPNHHNGHKARVLQTPFVALFLILFLIVQYGVKKTNVEILGYASQISTSEVIQLTNKKRSEQGLSTVVENAALTQAAKAKGLDMLSKGYWAHVAPDGTQPWDFFKNAGYKYRFAGENLARDFSNPNAAVEAWMASPSHRDNMLSDRYKEIGVAVVEGSLNGQDTTIIVQLFGTPSTTAPSVPTVAAAQEKKPAVATVRAANAEVPAVVVKEEPKVEAPASTPEPKVEPIPAEPEGIQNVQPVANTAVLPDTGRLLSLGLIAFFIGALLVDSVVLWMRGGTRRAGKPLAHIAFFGMIFVILILAKAGEIL